MNINQIFEGLKFLDCFGTTYSFYTEKNRKFYTAFGGIFTLLSIIFGILVFIYITISATSICVQNLFGFQKDRLIVKISKKLYEFLSSPFKSIFLFIKIV